MNVQLSLITYVPDGTLLYAINKADREKSYFETDFDKNLFESEFSGTLPDDFDMQKCYLYSLVDGNLKPSAFENITMAQCILLNSKLEAINLLLKTIVIRRNKLFNNDIFLQDHMYTVKYNQALSYKATGYDESQLSNFKLIVADTEIYNVSGQVAADKIIKTYEYFDNALISTEVSRVKNRHAIWNATTVEQIDDIKKLFLTQG